MHLHLSRSQWPLGRHRHCNPLPPFYFVFSFSYSVAKLQPCPFSDVVYPTLLLSAPASISLLAMFLVKSSWQDLMILIQAQTTLTCISLPWLRYHHRAQWLAWFCLWLHRWWCCQKCVFSPLAGRHHPNHKLKALLPPDYDNSRYNLLRRQRLFNMPKLCTNRTSNTFIYAMSKQSGL